MLEGEDSAECSDLAVIFARGTFDKGYVCLPISSRAFHQTNRIKLAT